MLSKALQERRNNRSRVARESGIDRVTLWRRLDRLGLSSIGEV